MATPPRSTDLLGPAAPADSTGVQPTVRLSAAPADSQVTAIEVNGTTLSRIGPYRLLHVLGEGGMGTVYLAEQEQPVQRRVALKILKGDVDARRVLVRFDQERQALARMNHPNVATVFDAGFTPVGQPFVVMEWIDGVPITRYCDDKRLPLRERLKLFLPVCQAVQHAHQKGIIHRDIKPSNVLVSQVDGQPIPRVIDFGIARITDARPPGDPAAGELVYIVGTPEYMAPEQADPANSDIDTRADVYALGVLLYELITGTPPPPATRVTRSHLPSVRLTQAPRPGIARPRQVAGDLDWIVARCLCFDRERRYEMAREVAREIERYLAEEPVTAAPASARYRLGKLVRRNRGPVLAAMLVLLTLIAGIVGTSVALVQAWNAEERARGENEAKQDALTRLEGEQQRTEAALAETRQANAQTMAALRDLADDLIERHLARQPQLTADDRAFLTKVLRHFEGFSATRGDTRQGRTFRVEGYVRVGSIRGYLGDLPGACTAYEQAIASLRQLVKEFPGKPAHRHHLAQVLTSLGAACRELARLDEAESAYREALTLQHQLAAAYPEHPQPRQGMVLLHGNLGNLCLIRGAVADAEGEYRQALALIRHSSGPATVTSEHRRVLSRTIALLGTALAMQGKYTEAEAAYREAVEHDRTLLLAFPDTPDHIVALAASSYNLGKLLADQKKPAEAEHRQARELRQRLVRDYPAVPGYRQDLASSHNALALVFAAKGKTAEAAAEYRQAIAIQEKLATDYPRVPDYFIELAGSYCNLGELHRRQGPPAEALKRYDQAIDALQQARRRTPQSAAAPRFLRNSLHGRIMTLMQLGRYPEALCDLDHGPLRDNPTFEPIRDRLRVLCLAHTDPSRAVTATEELLRGRLVPPDLAGMAASVFAMVAAQEKDAAAAENLAGRAVALFRQAHATAETRTPDHLRHLRFDPALAALRQRGDFQRLLQEMAQTLPRSPRSTLPELHGPPTP